MKIRKLPLIVYLISSLLLFPGWKNKQLNNAQYLIDQPLIPVHSAIVFNQKGKAICYVNLLDHPDLAPDFIELNINETIDSTSQPQAELIKNKSTLSPCSDPYLIHLKEAVQNNITNDATSYIHLSSWQNTPKMVGICALGITSYMVINNTNIEDTSPTKGGFVASGVAVVSAFSVPLYFGPEIDKLERLLTDKKISQETFNKYKNRVLNSTIATYTITICYAGTEFILVFYHNIKHLFN